MQPSIIIKNLHKKFRIGYDTKNSLCYLISALSGKEYKKTVWALQDVSLSIAKGEIVAIIGRNGAGKSTLLSIMAGIYQPDKGDVVIQGKIISVIGLTQGLLDRLTLRENVYLCCCIFGLDHKTIRQRFDSIVQFSGLQDYIETKLYQFSRGMLGRLIFSMAIHCDPDILLFDEATSNYDAEFTDFFWNSIGKLSHQGITTVLATHDQNIINHCTRTICLEKGCVVHS